MANQKATFAAGCFWGVQSDFDALPEVIETKAGYTGGHTKDPTYEDVCSDATGHAEAVEVTFDPKRISYKKLLDLFWKMHDPTQFHRQGPDVGSQYRSAIFYHSPSQKKEAEASMKAQQKKLDKPIVTEITKATAFYPAEEYHQKYYDKHPTYAKVCGILKH